MKNTVELLTMTAHIALLLVGIGFVRTINRKQKDN